VYKQTDVTWKLSRWPTPRGSRSSTAPPSGGCLHHLADLPIEEVAATLGARSGTIKSWLARGRRTLATRLGDPEEVRSR
jgi:hypothetical protein